MFLKTVTSIKNKESQSNCHMISGWDHDTKKKEKKEEEKKDLS